MLRLNIVHEEDASLRINYLNHSIINSIEVENEQRVEFTSLQLTEYNLTI